MCKYYLIKAGSPNNDLNRITPQITNSSVCLKKLNWAQSMNNEGSRSITAFSKSISDDFCLYFNLRKEQNSWSNAVHSNVCSNFATLAGALSNKLVIQIIQGFKFKQILGTYLVTVYWTHFNRAFLAFPWILVATFRLLGGLAVSALTVLSTEDVLPDKDCSCGRLLVNSSICSWVNRWQKHKNYLVLLSLDVTVPTKNNLNSHP